MSDAISFLTSSEQIQANYEKYKDKFEDSTAELVNSETFLNLLVAEMTNQDPLEPTSNTEFVTQMAQFTSLQYAQDSSKYAEANYASSLVGKTVTASKMDGSKQITKTGVVEQVMKNGDTYTLMIGGTKFELSHVTSVDAAAGSAGSDSNTISTGTALGDTIARASMMIGMQATISEKQEQGVKTETGIIESIQVKDGVVNVVIGGNAYKLSDVTEVKYPTVEVPDVDTDNKTETETQPEQEATEAVTGTETHPVEEEQFSPEDQALLDQLFEMLEQEQGDEQIDEDIQDLEDDIVTDEV
ncbi:MAG: hypothetical protein IJO91_01305 [Oscillospiraceae bacterium]|nr:hypothetical protein [Oscillospiraceae bacterium]